MVQVSHLPEALRSPVNRPGNGSLLQFANSVKEPSELPLPCLTVLSVNGLTLMRTKEKAEVLRITEALQKHHNNRLRAARELGD